MSKDAPGTTTSLLREADAQLYLAKCSGRNQTCGAEMQALEVEGGDRSSGTSIDPVTPVPVA